MLAGSHAKNVPRLRLGWSLHAPSNIWGGCGMSKNEEGKLKKQIESWGELQKQIFRLSNSIILKARSEAISETLEIPNTHNSFDNVKAILKILDEAKKEKPQLISVQATYGMTQKEHLQKAEVNAAKYIIENEKWFKKWFGEPEK